MAPWSGTRHCAVLHSLGEAHHAVQAVNQHAASICSQVDQVTASHAIWLSERACLIDALLTAAGLGTQEQLKAQVPHAARVTLLAKD